MEWLYLYANERWCFVAQKNKYILFMSSCTALFVEYVYINLELLYLPWWMCEGL